MYSTTTTIRLKFGLPDLPPISITRAVRIISSHRGNLLTWRGYENFCDILDTWLGTDAKYVPTAADSYNHITTPRMV